MIDVNMAIALRKKHDFSFTKSWEVQDDENLCISWEEKK